MQVTVDYAELQRACKLARKVVGNRTTLPVLAGAHLEVTANTLEITATNLETTIRTTLERIAHHAIDGRALVPVSALAAAVKDARPKGTRVTVETSGNDRNELHLRYDGLSFRLRQLDADDYPPLEVEHQPADVLVASDLELPRVWAERVLPAASDDEARPVLTAVHVERKGTVVSAAATDSYRLHTYQDPTEDYGASGIRDCSFLLPGHALQLALDAMKTHKATSGAVWYRKGDARLEIGPTTIMVRCVEGEFPDFEQLFHTDGGTEIAITDAAAAAGAVKTAETQAAASHMPVVLEHSGAETVLASVSVQDVGTCELPIPGLKAPEPFDTISLSPRFLREMLLANGEGTMHVLGGLKPALFDSGNGFRGLIMPVRIA